MCGVMRVLTRSLAHWTAPGWISHYSQRQRPQCYLRRARPLCRLCRSQPLPFHRLADSMYVAAPSCAPAHCKAHDLSCPSLMSVLWRLHVHRANSSRRPDAAAYAAPSCLAWPATSEAMKCVPAAICGTNEGSLSFTVLWLPPRQRVLLLLLLPLACPPLRQLQCCSHHQECTTPPATRAPPLLQRENKQQRGLLPSLLTIRL